MATKDWKKKGNVWRNSNKTLAVKIENETRGIAETPYQVYILFKGMVKSHRYFKTKKSATTFAKKYMRLH